MPDESRCTNVLCSMIAQHERLFLGLKLNRQILAPALTGILHAAPVWFLAVTTFGWAIDTDNLPLGLRPTKLPNWFCATRTTGHRT
ncbi:hypothetical protein OBBRIDRAFT_101342 [Obba rivulosa]|uniref:Uncharacterized protein n=1 Tax=Obba rivulosa TaxID=1052685 RepID=A0A8E2DRY7_9APHY|nr:hypothetical protein OBBRIDRAFT_101342 [Obba rivulosa]